MHVRAARTNGVSVDEIKELLLQTAIYCGVPDANTAFRIAQRCWGRWGRPNPAPVSLSRQDRSGAGPLDCRTTSWVGSTRAGVSLAPLTACCPRPEIA